MIPFFFMRNGWDGTLSRNIPKEREVRRQGTLDRGSFISPMSHFLTKITYLNGLQCLKRLWIETQMPEQVASISLAQKRILEQGSEVGAFAQTWFPEGVPITGKHGRDAIKQTQEAINSGASCLFEPAFEYDHLLVRCDILQKNVSGAWEIIEVKSSTGVKDEHLHDLAFPPRELQMFAHEKSLSHPEAPQRQPVEQLNS